MKSNFWQFGLGAWCAVAAALTAGAAPLQRADVAASPAWLVHLDCDALRPTSVGQFVLDQMDQPENKNKLAAFQTIFNVDLRTQLHGVTLYGGSPKHGDGVLIIYADFDPNRLVTLAKAATDYQSSQHNDHVIHSWVDDKKPAVDGVKPRVYASIQGNRVIFGQAEDHVAAALDVLDGTAPNLTSGRHFTDLGAPGNSHFIEAAMTKMDFGTADPNAALLKMAQSVELVLGEQQQQLQGTLTLVANDNDIAGHMLAVAQGLVALLKLQTNKPEALALANALVITQAGTTVTGVITLPSSDTVAMMKAATEKKAADHQALDGK